MDMGSEEGEIQTVALLTWVFWPILATLKRIENMGKNRQRRKIKNNIHSRQVDVEMPSDSQVR